VTALRVAELARALGGDVFGDGAALVTGVAGIREARPGDVTFLANPRYEPYLEQTRASVVLLAEPRPSLCVPQIVHASPYLAYLKAVKLFRGERPRPPAGVHPTAVIDPTAVLGAEVSVGPHAVVEAGATIGERTVLMAGVYIGHQSVLGADCWLYPNVTVCEECAIGNRVVVHPGAVIGADGFGYVRDSGAYQKVPQVGTVHIADDVEIGANTCIDRATTGVTTIGSGSKIDNLAQIGHNVVLHENVIVVAQVGVSGSTEVGRGATIAGQAGIGGHLQIGEGAVVGAQSGVTKSVPPHTQVSGYPAQPHAVAKRIHALTMRLPQLWERLQRLEERLRALEEERSDEHVRSRG
jgi:UDP-3-O-[3-hydroxymyristoyl] glucosamine N-acyltransferase